MSEISVKKVRERSRYKALGLFVCYYETYAERSVEEFKKLLSAIDPQCLIVLADNSGAQKFSRFADENVVVVAGDNRVQEFSAWDRAISYCSEVIEPDDDCIVVVANDTFCNHHRFGRLDLYFIPRFFKSLRERRKALIGEVNIASSPMEVMGLTLDRWIPTYLFALRWEGLKALAPMALSEIELGRAVRRTTIESNFFGDMNFELRERLTAWLFRPSRESWYKAGQLDAASLDMFYNKARTIICEKHFAARGAVIGYEFVDIFAEAHRLYFILFKARAAVLKIVRMIRAGFRR